MQPLLTLVPLGTKLRAEIEIPVDEISHVTEGQTVRLKLNALPFQKHGALEGRIEHISEDAFSGESEQLHYKGTIELTSEVSDLSGLSKDVRLLPGMQLAADIKVGKRRIASYFLYPFLKTLDESFREP